jgi:hypothetical protein
MSILSILQIKDLLRKFFRHTPALVRLKPHGARGECRENEFFSKVSVGSVARQRITYARGQKKKWFFLVFRKEDRNET